MHYNRTAENPRLKKKNKLESTEKKKEKNHSIHRGSVTQMTEFFIRSHGG